MILHVRSDGPDRHVQIMMTRSRSSVSCKELGEGGMRCDAMRWDDMDWDDTNGMGRRKDAQIC